jgi:hypothetical protein
MLTTPIMALAMLFVAPVRLLSRQTARARPR